MDLEFRLSQDAENIDRELVHHWLSELSVRVVTDRVTFAWLCDVFVAPEARGAGAGKLLVDGVLADLDALGVRRTLLSTADAHGLYAQYGFTPLAEPARWMGRGTV